MSASIEEKTHPFVAAAKAGRDAYKVADLSLADFGRNEIRLAEHEMPGLMSLRAEHRDPASQQTTSSACTRRFPPSYPTRWQEISRRGIRRRCSSSHRRDRGRRSCA